MSLHRFGEQLRIERGRAVEALDLREVPGAAIVAGVGTFRGRSVIVMGHEKGSDTESRIKHNFGMARPEGYRKAVRLIDNVTRP